MVAALATQLQDPENARLIYIGAGVLAALGVALAVGTRWWWKTVRVDHPVLAPLEVMGARRWRRSSEARQALELDRVRLDGALLTTLEESSEPFERLDALSAEENEVVDSFEDLRDLVRQPGAAGSDGAGDNHAVDAGEAGDDDDDDGDEPAGGPESATSDVAAIGEAAAATASPIATGPATPIVISTFTSKREATVGSTPPAVAEPDQVEQPVVAEPPARRPIDPLLLRRHTD